MTTTSYTVVRIKPGLTDFARTFDSPNQVCIWALGRPLREYTFIKTVWYADGSRSDSLLSEPSSDIRYLELQLNIL